jgi:hypothetical protein
MRSQGHGNPNARNRPSLHPHTARSVRQFGETLAYAERSLTAILRTHLAERDRTPKQRRLRPTRSPKGCHRLHE